MIRALHELIEAVAVYSTADEGALHTRLADRAVCIGLAPPARANLKIPLGHRGRDDHPFRGRPPRLGLPQENPAFADACAESDLVFVGPTAETMTRMGDKAAAKQEMDAAGCWSCSARSRRQRSTRLVAPRMTPGTQFLKAVAGGGKGMRLVREPDELEAAFQTAAAEAQAAVRRARAVRREGDRPCAARRDPGARGLAGRRPDPRRA